MGLQDNMRNEPVRRLHLRAPVLAAPGETVRQAIVRMRDRQLGCVYVVDERGQPLGAFTESVLNQLLVADPDAIEDPLHKHMASDFSRVRLDDPIVLVLRAMQLDNARFVCVLDEQGRVTGLAGQKSLMEYIADHFPGQVMVQRVGCAPFIRHREGA